MTGLPNLPDNDRPYRRLLHAMNVSSELDERVFGIVGLGSVR